MIGSIVGVDLGTRTGVATLPLMAGQSIRVMTLDLLAERERRQLTKSNPNALRFFDPRVERLWKQMTDIISMLPEPVFLAFEDVRFAKSLAQAQLWSSLRGALWCLPIHPSRFFSVPTSTLKSYAGAKGPSKEAMEAVFRAKFRCQGTVDDNMTKLGLTLIGGNYGKTT